MINERQELLTHDFNLKNNSRELDKIARHIELMENMVKDIALTKVMSFGTYNKLYNQTVHFLDNLGILSLKTMQLDEEIERMYKKHYMNAPELGKKMWYEHYSMLNKPYTVLKNKCYGILDDLNVEHKLIFKTKSKNDFSPKCKALDVVEEED